MGAPAPGHLQGGAPRQGTQLLHDHIGVCCQHVLQQLADHASAHGRCCTSDLPSVMAVIRECLKHRRPSLTLFASFHEDTAGLRSSALPWNAGVTSASTAAREASSSGAASRRPTGAGRASHRVPSPKKYLAKGQFLLCHLVEAREASAADMTTALAWSRQCETHCVRLTLPEHRPGLKP
jgi:hypothetical protein